MLKQLKSVVSLNEPLLDQEVDNDPYHGFKENISSQLQKISVKYNTFQELLVSSNISSSAEFHDIRKNLLKDLRAFDKEFAVIKKAVITIEKNRQKFPQISEAEFISRKSFVNNSEITIQDIKSGMESPMVLKKIQNDLNNQNQKSIKNANPSRIAENNHFIQNQKQQTQQMIAQQDYSVELLGKSVDKLGHIAKEINTEVKEQNLLLDNLEGDVDAAGDKLDTVQKALEKLLKSKDGCQIWTIVILVGILALLVALVIWT
eukprot:gene5434-7527_t